MQPGAGFALAAPLLRNCGLLGAAQRRHASDSAFRACLPGACQTCQVHPAGCLCRSGLLRPPLPRVDLTEADRSLAQSGRRCTPHRCAPIVPDARLVTENAGRPRQGCLRQNRQSVVWMGHSHPQMPAAAWPALQQCPCLSVAGISQPVLQRCFGLQRALRKPRYSPTLEAVLLMLRQFQRRTGPTVGLPWPAPFLRG